MVSTNRRRFVVGIHKYCFVAGVALAGRILRVPLFAFSNTKEERTHKVDPTNRQVLEIIVKQLGIDPKKVRAKSRLVKDLGASPTDVRAIITAIEKRFNIQIPEADSARILTLRDAVLYVKSHGKSSSSKADSSDVITEPARTLEPSQIPPSYVIGAACVGVKDTACVDACPVDCIHPKKEETGFAKSEQLFIDPWECIHCTACVPVCPVSAVFAPDKSLPAKWEPFVQKNALYFAAAHRR